MAVAAAQDGEESKQVEQEDDHRARIVSGSKLTVQPPDRRTEFGEAQVPNEPPATRSEEHTSELQSLAYLVCRLLLEKKKKYKLTASSQDAWAAALVTESYTA